VRSSGGPYTAYCVRLCDGRYFPIQARRNISTAQQCSSVCPASETRVFAGSGIEHATSGGRRYADLPNAFVYRKRLVPGCTCNGKDPVGLAPIPLDEDATLRPGDIVATNSGFGVYNGSKRQTAFTPLDVAKVSRSVRERLADVKVAPQLPDPAADAEAKPEPTPEEHASIQGSLRLSAR